MPSLALELEVTRGTLCYRDAWARFYSDDHIATLFRRARASGMGLTKLANTLMVFSGGVRIENCHPLQLGFFRRKAGGAILRALVRRMAPHKTSEDPMTSSKSKRKPAPRSHQVKTAKPKSSKRPLSSGTASTALSKKRSGTKNAQVVAMLRDRAGATIAAIAAATGWQQHSVRGFLAGVVRRKLGLNLVSEPSDGGRIYRVNGETVGPAKAGQVKQAA